MTREDMVRLFARRDEAIRQLDADTLASDLADDAIAESPMLGVLRGRERIAEVYHTWFTAFPDLQFTSDDLLIDGNRAAQFFRVRGTHSKTFGGIPPTGRRVEFKGCGLFTISDEGKIVREQRLYDLTNLLVQLGALKPKPTPPAT